uniref:PARP catalytic domain-containing protein n=1 Tax=Astyanax mexicanus TaxID=7994 RepID=A0A8B9LVR5_ASTMX
AFEQPVKYNQSYIMYHSTSLSNACQIMIIGFTPSTGGMLGPGVYLSKSYTKACAYPKSLPPGEEQVIIKARVRVGKVKRIDYQGHPLQYSWHKKGYDTAWVPPNCGMVPSGLEEDCVWDPKRIEILNISNMDAVLRTLSYTMYHGTTLSNARQIVRNGFIPSSGGMLGPGVYVSRSFQKACAYPQVLPPGEERVVLKIRVRVGKVKRIDYNGHPLQYTWHQHGYDTAWVPPMCGMVPSGLEEDCLWDPKRIEVLAVLDKPA